MKIIDHHYQNQYNTIFRKVLRDSPAGFYDETALPSYTHANKIMSWFFWHRINTVFSLLTDIQGKSVLDFGCGGAITFKYLHDRNCRITGCDTFSKKLAEKISSKLEIKADIYSELSEIKEKKFDIILALDVLEHVENLDAIIDDILLLSHKETKIVLCGPTENFFYKTGRMLAGFHHADYHARNIYKIEKIFCEKNLTKIAFKKLIPPITLFRISIWQSG